MADPTQGGSDDPFATPQGETAEASIVPHAPVRETDALELPTIEPGNYRVGEEAGRGAIGRVWRARDRRLGRPVAIKELLERRGHNEARFVREALVTARLQHPGIVPVYEAGRWPSGEPFYAMKFVEGRSLHAAVVACKTLNERMALVPNVLAVAETIAYAHGQGVVHRDLKPANVVVGEYGETVVIDWGLAKDRELADSLDGDEATDLYEITHAQMTRVGAVVGTPAYMPLEQARGEPVDERADVYAVGAMLYHVLAARPPYEGASDQVLAQVLAGPPVPLATRVDGLPRDLLAIVDKAMARAPEDRYATGKELAQDLSRFLTGQLVGAREYSRLTLIGRWLKKHRYIVGAVSVLLAALAATAIVSARRIVRERNVAQARSAQLVLSQARAVIDADPTAALAWLEQYPDFGTEWTQVQQIASDALSRGVSGHVWRVPSNSTRIATISPDGGRVAMVAWSTIELRDTATGKRVASVAIDDANILAFSTDGRRLWVGTLKGDLLTVDMRSPQAPPSRVKAHDGWIEQLVVSDDGKLVVTAGSDHVIRLWACAPDGSTVVPLDTWKGLTKTIVKVVLSDGQIWISAEDGTIRRYHRGTRDSEVILDLRRPIAPPMAATRDGRTMVAADGERILWWRDGILTDVGTQSVPVTLLYLRADGSEAFSLGQDSLVRMWTRSGLAGELADNQGRPLSLALLDDATAVACVDDKGTITVWRGSQVDVLRGHRQPPLAQFTRDGHFLMTVDRDGETRWWALERQDTLVGVARRAVFELAFSADSRGLVTTSKDGGVTRLDVHSNAPQRLGNHSLAAYDLAAFHDGRRFVSSSWDGSVAVWDPSLATPEVARWKHPKPVWSVDVAPDDHRVASADEDGTVLVHDLRDGSETKPLTVEGEARKVLFSPDGTKLAAGGTAGTIHVKTLPDGPDVVLRGHTDGVSALAFSADGRTLYSASWDGTLRIWDLATQKSRVLTGHTQRIRTMALSPDGKTLASGSADRTIRLWDVATGASKVLRGHTAEVRHVAFSPDGAWLASAGWDATVRLWHLGDGRSVVLRGHADLVHRVAFSPDGKVLASAGEDGAVGLWNLADVDAVPGTPKELRAWLAATTTAVIGADETLATRP